MQQFALRQLSRLFQFPQAADVVTKALCHCHPADAAVDYRLYLHATLQPAKLRKPEQMRRCRFLKPPGGFKGPSTT